MRNKKTDEDRTALACILWSIAFIAGMFIAAIQNAKPFGVMLMLVSTLILAIYIWADTRIEHGNKVHKFYIDEMTRQEIEARTRRSERK